MKIVLKLFSSYKEAVGAAVLELEVTDGTTVDALIKRLKMEHPNLSKFTDEIIVAVNLEYSPYDKVLSEGDEVALLPPVSGG